MIKNLQSYLVFTIKVLLCTAPMLASMFLLYWMSSNEIWNETTPHRDLITGGVVASGLISAYFLLSWFVLRSK